MVGMPAPSYGELREQNQRLIQELRKYQAENARLRGAVNRLTQANTKLTEALEQLQRSAKRQAAPFSKREPKQHPKRPGRKPGADYGKQGQREPPPPEKINEVHEAPLPAVCPDCGGAVAETRVDQQYQVEIPRQPIWRQFNVHIGCCPQCGKRVQGRHPLQTSDALGAAANQIGSDAQAAMAILNKHAGLSHGKIQAVFSDLFGIELDRSTSVRTVLRLGKRLDPRYQEIGAVLRDGDYVVPDETGWRVGGKKAWLHVLASHEAVYYGVEPDRSGAFAERVLGLDWAGNMTHDGWSVYDNFVDAVHQQCLGHVEQRAKEILEVAPGVATRFPRQVLDLFGEALDLRDRFRAGQVSRVRLVRAAETFHERLVRLTQVTKSYTPNEKLAAHLYRHAAEWFLFLIDPAIEATNWLAEQAIRLAVVNRKVWGGNRTWPGAHAQAVLTSVIQTCRKQAVVVLDFLSQSLRGLSPILFPATR